ncbi:MAG TPA: mechanosensitive ion channel domain-containing protein [Burkholderiales bacterium]
MNRILLVRAGLVLLMPVLLAPLLAVAQEVQRQRASVVIANRVIIELRGPVAGYSAEERARSSIERIEAALDAEPNAEASYGDTEEGTRVRLGGRHAFIVTKIDIDAAAGETTQIVAREAIRRLERAIVERREQRSMRYMATAAALAAAATLVYGLLLWLVYRATRWLGARVGTAAEARARRLNLRGVNRLAIQAIRVFGWLLAIALTTTWLSFVLMRFPYTRAWGERVESSLLDLARQVLLAIAGAAPGLVVVAIIFVLTKAVIGLVRPFFDRIEAGHLQVRWLTEDTVRPTRRIFAFLAWMFALAMAYPYLPGANTDAFKGLSVLVGLMISLGGASVIGQAFNGLILMYAGVFRRGDYVRIGDNEGTVVELGMFATRLRTGMGEEVTLSNSSVMATTTKNYSRAVPGAGCIVDTTVTIGYGTPWRQVEAMLAEAARRTADIAREPPPYVRQTALSDYYVEYRLVAYTPLERSSPRVEVLHRLHGNVQDVFNEHGVQIMSPHYVLDPKSPQVVPKDQWFAPPAQAPREK